MLPRLLFLLSVALPAFAQSNPEMARIFDADQKDRANWFTLSRADRKAVAKRDTARRQRVGNMVRDGLLKTGEDFEKAAFVFQHGLKLTDFAMAHALALSASAMEPFRGAWIAAASFDRYLYRSGKPQIFGTALDDKTPFDKQFLPDSIRVANCVPSLAVRERQVREIAEKRPIATPGPCNARPETLMGKWSLTLRSPDGTFSQALLEFSGTAANLDVAFTENGRTSDPDQLTLGDRKLDFRVDGRAFQVTINGEEMTGTFTSAGGGQGRLVGLVSRPPTPVGP
jgi:hypothetical protein